VNSANFIKLSHIFPEIFNFSWEIVFLCCTLDIEDSVARSTAAAAALSADLRLLRGRKLPGTGLDVPMMGYY